jgi:hypothetical protein
MAGHPLFAAMCDRMSAHAERAGFADLRTEVRPDGRLLLLEHIRDPGDGSLGRWQGQLRTRWGRVAGGCAPNRDTRATLAAAGFDVTALEPAALPTPPPLVRPARRGSATPSSG